MPGGAANSSSHIPSCARAAEDVVRHHYHGHFTCLLHYVDPTRAAEVRDTLPIPREQKHECDYTLVSGDTLVLAMYRSTTCCNCSPASLTAFPALRTLELLAR